MSSFTDELEVGPDHASWGLTILKVALWRGHINFMKDLIMTRFRHGIFNHSWAATWSHVSGTSAVTLKEEGCP